MSFLRAFGGGELVGEKFVRYAYLDESGIGDTTTEPYVVVAGVVVEVDLQTQPIEQHLKDLFEEFIRPEDKNKEDLFFHASDLLHGAGHFPRERYPKHVRHQMLYELCSIPAKFDLPVVMGHVERANVAARYPRATISELTTMAQVVASIGCLLAIEGYMRDPAREKELATLIYEDNVQAKRMIRATHNAFKTKVPTDIEAEQAPSVSRHLPLRKIAGTAFFSEKNECSLLQVADAVVYTISRKLRGKEFGDYFFAPFDEQLIVRPTSFPLPPSLRNVEP